ncbi:hypothetical protein JOH50_004865 [Rhizobium leguminosarum]|uniref:hypothetical protein n=1 Tax=Rhizobium leguminosarum TaxID=384 RepID=UPI001AE502FB|nr:hypothetical protein [Rhizobium leguminosarum]MBP2489138.1 hypothetical protein [Rhizobium leguminosarum]
MPITFTPISRASEWSGNSWTISSDDELAKLVAQVALGQSHFAKRVLVETGFRPSSPGSTTLQGAVKLLSASDPKKPYHRDGWLFQVISWIAAHLQQPGGLIMEPHMIHAHKGFDGVHVHLDGVTGHVERVTICEEKATQNPRNMITRIWKEFEEMERGDSDHRLLSEVIMILRLGSGIDVDKAIENLIWKNRRGYRVSITVPTKADYLELFEGYDTAVAGDVSKRGSEVLPLTNMRDWMAAVSAKAIDHAKKVVQANV